MVAGLMMGADALCQNIYDSQTSDLFDPSSPFNLPIECQVLNTNCTKVGFYEFANEDLPRVHIYLQQTAVATGNKINDASSNSIDEGSLSLTSLCVLNPTNGDYNGHNDRRGRRNFLLGWWFLYFLYKKKDVQIYSASSPMWTETQMGSNTLNGVVNGYTITIQTNDYVVLADYRHAAATGLSPQWNWMVNDLGEGYGDGNWEFLYQTYGSDLGKYTFPSVGISASPTVTTREDDSEWTNGITEGNPIAMAGIAVSGYTNHFVTYTLANEFTTALLKGLTAPKLDAQQFDASQDCTTLSIGSMDWSACGAGAYQFLANPDTNCASYSLALSDVLSDELSYTNQKARYSFASQTLTENQLYLLVEKLSVWTNHVFAKWYYRVCPVMGNGAAFCDALEIDPVLAGGSVQFHVHDKQMQSDQVLVGELAGQTEVALTRVMIWRKQDFDFHKLPDFNKDCSGMPVWQVSEPDINLWVADTPLTYTTSLGQEIAFHVVYDQRYPRLAGCPVPITGWNNNWSSYIHVTGNYDITNNTVDFTRWSALLYSPGGGVSDFGYTNYIDPDTQSTLTPLNGMDPTGNAGTAGLVGIRLVATDGSQDIYGLVTAPYTSTNQVLQLINKGLLPGGMRYLNYNAGLWAGAVGSSEYGWIDGSSLGGDSSNTNGGSSGGPGGNNPDDSSSGGGGSVPPGSGQALLGWQIPPDSIVVSNEVDALLTEHIDKFGNRIHYYYTSVLNGSGQVNYLLKYVVDYDGKTNTIVYDSANHISQVINPYGLTANFLCNNQGQFTQITDAQGMTNSMVYDTGTGFLTNLHTPYGDTYFDITNADTVNEDGVDLGFAGGTTGITRAIRVTNPNLSKELFAYSRDSYQSGILQECPTEQVPAGWDLDDGSAYSDSDPDAAFYMRNSFHWGPKQYAALSTEDFNQFSHDDYKLAEVSHWLLGTTPNTLSEKISARREPSPGNLDGSVDGQITWFHYPGMTGNCQLPSLPPILPGELITPLVNSPDLVALVLPDGSTRYTQTAYNGFGKPVSVTSTYSLPDDGSVGTRTTAFTYTNITATQVFMSGGNAVYTNSWVYPELLQVVNVGAKLGLSAPDSVQTINESLAGFTTSMQLPWHRKLTMTNAVSDVTTSYYNPRGQLAGVKSPAGLTTTNLYDSNGFPAQTIDLEIKRTNSFVFNNGQLSVATSPSGLVTHYFWDNLQRLTGVGFPDNTSISNIYTRLDLTGQKDRLGNWVHAGYDSMGYMTSFTDKNSYVTQLGRCPCGALESITDPLNTSTFYTWDYDGRITGINDTASGRSFSLIRNSLGQITTVIDNASSDSFFYYYNNQGCLTNVQYGWGNTWNLYQAIYDVYDRPMSVVNAEGITVTSTYDLLGRVFAALSERSNGAFRIYGAGACFPSGFERPFCHLWLRSGGAAHQRHQRQFGGDELQL